MVCRAAATVRRRCTLIAGDLSLGEFANSPARRTASTLGELAAESVASSTPDGYTMLIGTSSLTTSRNLYHSLRYELSDLAPVTLVCTFPLLMLAPTTSPVKSIAEFIAFARANRGKVTFASPGVGTVPHLAGELFKQMAGIEMTHIPIGAMRLHSRIQWQDASICRSVAPQ
jgi:tripartite-type tricarboxylate transporter receptor subunit TctC